MLSVEEFGGEFSKRLEGSGRRSVVKTPPSGRSKSISRAGRRNTLDPSMLPGNRGQPVPQVEEVGCGCKTWNRIGLGLDSGSSSSTSTSEPTRKSQSGDKTPVSPSTTICNRKLAKSVTGIFFRRTKTAPPAAPSSSSSPKFQEQWSSFREQHQQEMNEMKQMYSALHSMCQEIKTITGLQPGVAAQAGVDSPPAATPRALTFGEKTPTTPTIDSSSLQSTPRPLVALRPAKTAIMNSEKRAAAGNRGSLVTPRRARSVPRTRRSGNNRQSHPPARDLSSSVNLFFRSPWTDITATLFQEIVQVQKTFLRSFCQCVVKQRESELNPNPSSNPNVNPNANPNAGLTPSKSSIPFPTDEVSALVGRLLPQTAFAKPWHLKYAVEAWINRVVLGDFGTDSYGLDEVGKAGTAATPTKGGDSMSSKVAQVSPWDEYQKLAFLSPSDAINPARKKAGLYHERFHLFCNRKFQAIHEELGWWEEWPPTLVEEFLEAMKHVWRAHKLAFAFDSPAAIFCVKTSTAFDPNYMEPVLEVSQFDSSTFTSKVGFMVTPGFLVHGQVIKSQVYLMPKVGRLVCGSPAK